MRGLLIGLSAVMALAASVQVASAGPGFIEQAKLTASDGTTLDFVGATVAVSGDTLVIGAYFDDHAGVV